MLKSENGRVTSIVVISDTNEGDRLDMILFSHIFMARQQIIYSDHVIL